MHRGVVKVILFTVPILLLLGVGLAGIMRWREAANRARCRDNLRRLGWFALWDYADKPFAFPQGPKPADLEGVLRDDMKPSPDVPFPPGTLANPNLIPEHRLSWLVILLPHLGRDDVHRQFDLTRGWDDPANAGAIATKM